MTFETDEDGHRVACLMMAAGGLKVRDIARIMKVNDAQVEAWLQQPGSDTNKVKTDDET